MRKPILLLAAVLALTPPPAALALDDTSGKPVARSATHRIISLSPANTEMLFAIGAGPMVVGVSDYCNFPAEASRRPRVGAVMTLNLEKTLSLKPDLFITADGNPRFYERLDRLSKAQIVQFSSVTLASVAQNIRELGEVTGREVQANALASRIDAGIRTAQQKAAKRQKRPRVFYMVWGEPLITAGPGSYLDDLIRTAGGVNAVRDLPEGNPYPPYSWEALVAADPDVIVAPEHLKPTLDRLKRTQPGLKAVRTNRVVLLNDDLVSRPGPRVLEALDAVTKAIGP